jgi:hypothetical protein
MAETTQLDQILAQRLMDARTRGMIKWIHSNLADGLTISCLLEVGRQ